MKAIGIIGAADIGITVATHLLRNNISVLISNSRGPETLKDTVAELGNGAKAVSVTEAAGADIILLALPWPKVKDLTHVIDWSGKIVIDATNHFTSNGGVADTGQLASSEVVQNYLPGAIIVKAFNTLFANVLAADPAVGKGKRVLFISGDDEEAKVKVSVIIKAIGFAPIDLGSLANGSKYQQAQGTLNALELIKL